MVSKKMYFPCILSPGKDPVVHQVQRAISHDQSTVVQETLVIKLMKFLLSSTVWGCSFYSQRIILRPISKNQGQVVLSSSRKYRVTHSPTLFLPEVQYLAHISTSTKSSNCGEPCSPWTHAGPCSVTSAEGVLKNSSFESTQAPQLKIDPPRKMTTGRLADNIYNKPRWQGSPSDNYTPMWYQHPCQKTQTGGF